MANPETKSPRCLKDSSWLFFGEHNITKAQALERFFKKTGQVAARVVRWQGWLYVGPIEEKNR